MNSTRNLLLVCILLSLSLTGYSQGWERAYSGAMGRLSDLTQTSDGGYIVCGTRLGGSFDQSQLSKIDLNGDVAWTKNISTDTFMNTPYTVIETNNNDGYLVGGTWMHKDYTTLRLGQAQLSRTDQWGNLLWTRRYGSPVRNEVIFDLINCHGGGYAFVMSQDSNFTNVIKENVLVRVDEQGNTLWQTGLRQALDSKATSSGLLLQLADSSFISFVKTDTSARLIKISPSGQILWSNELQVSTPNTYLIQKILQLGNGEFRLIGSINMVDLPGNTSTLSDIFILNVSAAGQLVSSQVIDYQGAVQNAVTADLISNDRIAIGGLHVTPDRPLEDSAPFLAVIDATETIQFYHIFTSDPPNAVYPIASKLIADINGGYIILVRGLTNGGYLIRTDSLGHSFTNVIKGTVFGDLNDDCMITSGEPLLDRWLVQLSGEMEQYTLTDSAGRYEFLTDTGQYVVKVLPPNNFWENNCFDSVEHQFTTFFDTLEANYPIHPRIDCPYLEVDISTPFLRRCFVNTYYVQYCNIGTDTTPTSNVDILLDSFLILESASLPFTQIDSNLYSFDTGELAIGECRQFSFDVLVSCDAVLGQTHCVEARMYPFTLCDSSSSWSGASIVAEGQCIGDSVRFVLRNIGTANTSAPLNYMVIIDDVILRQNTFSLPPGDSMVIYEAVSGQTARLQAQQESHHPLNNQPSVSIEGCGADGGPISLGFVTQFPQDDSYNSIDIDCRENQASYDPNDKQGFPTGYAAQRFIEPNTDLEYLIRFQNTGTDTAFRVVIRDTLQEGLNVSTVRAGAASHDYQFEILGNNILQFTFDNILLPDSNINELASHGFIKFTIDQTKDNPLGMRIENEAAIYFDFNAPIITNTTFHTIQEEFITVSIDPQPIARAPEVLVRPNPMGSSAILELEGTPKDQLEFRLYDSSGRLLRQATFSGNQYEIHKGTLAEGLYLFQILNSHLILSSGKLVVH